MSDRAIPLLGRPPHPALRAGHGLGDLAREILDRRLYAVLATENDDGSSHLAPVMFLFEGGELTIETGSTTRKARNVAARPRASVLIDTPEASWVFGAGPARTVTGIDAERRNRRIRAKYLTASGERACGGLLAELDDVTIVVTPARWMSWDLTVLMETLAGRGVDLDGADGWFHADG